MLRDEPAHGFERLGIPRRVLGHPLPRRSVEYAGRVRIVGTWVHPRGVEPLTSIRCRPLRGSPRAELLQRLGQYRRGVAGTQPAAEIGDDSEVKSTDASAPADIAEKAKYEDAVRQRIGSEWTFLVRRTR